MIVPSTMRISINANFIFLKPNCIGVNMKLDIRLIIKGSVCKNVNSPLKAFTNTEPKEMNINIYKIDHMGPKTQLGGAHLGFFKSKYQDEVF